MLSEFKMPTANSFDELNARRLEALELLDRCLRDQTTGWLESFIERVVISEPLQVQLLNEVAEDVHYRLLALHQFHFDLRDQTVRTLRDEYGLNLHQLLSSPTLEDFHLLDADHTIRILCTQPHLTATDAARIRELLRSSIESAQRAHNEMQLARHLYDCIMDWVTGLRVLFLQRLWTAHGRTEILHHVQ